MTHYRLYCLDSGMHIIAHREFDAEDDASAIALAQSDDPASDREIWDEHRKVALIPASASPRSSGSTA